MTLLLYSAAVLVLCWIASARMLRSTDGYGFDIRLLS
jgi:hypothetical protein